ncbi:Uncharacterized conserved protein, DUF1501 family [Bizionia echini]|uniref:Uncharacterized conserved protein, DUF1501 family n=1 Tax=Bizionia echini TaxID=649333 RepID=A0A1I4ZFB5_9FLAO|nr:DUF1501 domain-containing protein [Bizionia echini]SFN48867.1 Uncharacterized conserved protein, DUF1501 family [Bizionia echini]
MDRRHFLKNTTLASSLFFIPSFIRAFEDTLSSNLGYKRLVIIQLSGGNDGLNTIIPFQNDIYYRSRPKLALKRPDLIPITDDLAFHGALKPLKRLYDQGLLSIINNVGYPNPNRSHFRATDIWQTASPSNTYYKNGWIGRFLDQHGNEPYNAIELNESLSLALQGKKLSGMAFENPNTFYQLSQDPFIKQVTKQNEDTHLSEHNLGYLYKTMIAAESSAKYIHEKNTIKNSSIDYPKNGLAYQLKTTASFINSRLKTKVFYASLDGFDTHVNQVNTHSKLLKTYAETVEVFVNDLKAHGTFDDTLILTFSEFGRRVKQNSGNGTDHGTANNVFVIGNKLKKPGVYNPLASLSDLDDQGDIKFEIDFRAIYATVLNTWLDVDAEPILNNRFNHLDFI